MVAQVTCWSKNWYLVLEDHSRLYLINHFKQVFIQTCLKLQKCNPLHKGGSNQIKDNYRPISLLPVISKILEKLMFAHMTRYVNTHNILYMKQFGFKENRSTQHAVCTFLSDILNGFKDNFYTLALFIDLRKAFDTVDHTILLNYLQNVGFDEIVLDWFKSYLANRKQHVVVNGPRSKETWITGGVPQGRVLAPQLFYILLIACLNIYVLVIVSYLQMIQQYV